jgi:ABC-type transport system involved in multi-copper enzyme maturation permease subunit
MTLGILTIAGLTLHEAARRRILTAAFVCGAAFLALYATGAHFMARDFARHETSLIERHMFMTFLTLAGLYAVNFLTVMTAVLLPVDTLSGEIASGVMQTLVSKPIRRAEIVLGKWLAHVVLIAAYLTLMAGGVLTIAQVIGSGIPPHVTIGIPLMLLEGTVLVTLSIAGGTRLSTVTNGVFVFGLYGLAFIGSWVEQIGTLAGNDTARYVGTIASLIMPTEAMWQLAAHHMQPAIMRDLAATPFSPASVPSPAMVVWAAAYAAVALLVAVLSFRKRGL